MIQLDFSIYKKTQIYFLFYDAFLKNKSINKEILFKKIDINYSSYRRARDYEQKVGEQILKQLCEYYQLKMPSMKLIDQLEKLANKIYHNMYYKIYDTYEDDIKELDKLIEEKYILFPILKLLRLFLNVNANRPIYKVVNDNVELYNEVKIYRKFFIEELKEIFEILSFFFETEIPEEEWSKSCDNALTYQILSSRYLNVNKFIEALFYAYKAKDIFLEDLNYKRVNLINRTIMICLLHIGKYEDCYKLAIKQKLSLAAYCQDNDETEMINEYLLVALLGLKRYDKIINLLINSKEYSLTTLTCLLVAIYENNKKDYDKYFKENVYLEEFNEETKNIIINIDHYLHHKDKRILTKIEEARKIMTPLIKILRKI